MGFRALECPPSGTTKDRRAGWASSSAEFAAWTKQPNERSFLKFASST